MVQILETGDPQKKMVYVTVGESLADVLAGQKGNSGVYYDSKGKKIGHHWLLSPITVGKLKIDPK